MGSAFRVWSCVLTLSIFTGSVFLSSQSAASSGRRHFQSRHFENRRTAEEYVQSLNRAKEFLGLLGLTEIVANASSGAELNAEFIFLPSKLDSPNKRYALVDTRLKLNPEDLGKVLSHSSGSLGLQLEVQLPGEIGNQQVAIHLVGLEKSEVEGALKSHKLNYHSSLKKSAGGRAPASEVRSSSTAGTTRASEANADEQSAGEQLWSSFRACGGGFVRGFNQIVLYPVYALNSAWVYVFGDSLGVGKIDDSQFAKDPVQAVFASNKTRYRSAFSQSWDAYWAKEKRAAQAVVDGFSDYKTILAKGYNGYVGMTSEEKSAFNCALTSGLGTAALAKVATQVSIKAAQAGVKASEVTTTAQASRIVETPAVIAARQRIAAREVQRQQSSPISYEPSGIASRSQMEAPSIKGLEVREIFTDVDGINVPPDQLAKMYGQFDPSKIKRAPEPPKPPPPPKSAGKRYSAILDVGDGRKMPVQFEVISQPSPRGFVQIRFENPLHRGQMTEKSIRWGELEISPGFKELSSQ